MKTLLFLVVLATQDDARIQDLMDQLSSDDPQERQRASANLATLGQAAVPKLAAILNGTTDPEVRGRLEQVIAQLNADSRASRLAGRLSDKLSKDADLLRELLSVRPEDVLAGLGKISGRAVRRRENGFEIFEVNSKHSPVKEDLETILREVLLPIPANNGSWISVKVLALRLVDDRNLAGLADLVKPMFRDADPDIRERAILAASGFRDAGIVEAVLPLLEDSCAPVRHAAVTALLHQHAEGQVAKIVEMTRDSNRDVRMRALEVLLSFEAKDRLGDIARMTRDESRAIRKYALGALRALKGTAFSDDIAGRLEDSDEEVRFEALFTIQSLGLKKCAPAVARALEDGCTYVRSRALETLETFGCAEYAPQIVKLLNPQEFDHIRSRAIRVLVAFASKSSAEDIAKLLKDESPDIRWNALDALYRLDARTFASDVAKTLEDSRDYMQVRAAEVLLAWNVSEDLPAIKRLMDSPRPSVAGPIACAVAEAGGRDAIRGLEQILSEEDSPYVTRALFAANVLRQPKLCEKLRTSRLTTREFKGVQISVVLGAVEQGARTDVSVQTSIDKTFSFTLSGAEANALQMLKTLSSNSENQFALILEERGIRVTTLAAARDFWRDWLSQNR